MRTRRTGEGLELLAPRAFWQRMAPLPLLPGPSPAAACALLAAAAAVAAQSDRKSVV